jgi:competence protein ComEC
MRMKSRMTAHRDFGPKELRRDEKYRNAVSRLPGSSFSYFADGHFTVMEGRLTELSRPALVYEMGRCGVDFAKRLHITSWDMDHCNKHELQELLDLIRPLQIECPGYNPYTDDGEGCLEIIGAYKDAQAKANRPAMITHITPRYGWKRPRLWPSTTRSTTRCTSTRSAQTTIPRCSTSGEEASTSSAVDVESPNIAARLRRSRILKSAQM